MSCSSGCRSKTCDSYGACLRNKHIQVDEHALAHGAEEKAKNRELDLYESARRQGIQPDTTKTTDIRRAVDISNDAGVAYGGS